MASQTNAIDEIAFAWAAKIDGAPLDDTEQSSLDAWVDADPRHAGAFARAMAANMYFERAAALGPDFDPGRPAAWQLPSLSLDRRALLAGVSLAATAIVGGGWAYRSIRAQDRVATAKGVIQRHPLADGSSMVLNTATEVELQFDAAARRIQLLSGEARFDVAKDARRPFIVSAGEIVVRAIGTSFSVWRHDDDSTYVVVAEGIVELGRHGETLIARLAAGRMVRVAGDGKLTETALSSDGLDQASAWTSGLIDLNGLSLGEAAAQFRRYSETRIEMDDPAVAAMRVSGVYSINNPIGFARDAALSLGLETIATGDGIRIRRRNI